MDFATLSQRIKKEWTQVRGNAKWDGYKWVSLVILGVLAIVFAFLRYGPAIQVCAFFAFAFAAALIWGFFGSKIGRVCASISGVCALLIFIFGAFEHSASIPPVASSVPNGVSIVASNISGIGTISGGNNTMDVGPKTFNISGGNNQIGNGNTQYIGERPERMISVPNQKLLAEKLKDFPRDVLKEYRDGKAFPSAIELGFNADDPEESRFSRDIFRAFEMGQVLMGGGGGFGEEIQHQLPSGLTIVPRLQNSERAVEVLSNAFVTVGIQVNVTNDCPHTRAGFIWIIIGKR